MAQLAGSWRALRRQRSDCRHLFAAALLFAVLIGPSVGQYTLEAEADRVTSLPGVEELKAGLFSGCARAAMNFQLLWKALCLSPISDQVLTPQDLCGPRALVKGLSCYVSSAWGASSSMGLLCTGLERA